MKIRQFSIKNVFEKLFKLIQNYLNLAINSNYECIIMNYFDTAQKMKFSIKDFFCIWSKRVTFWAVQFPTLIIYLVVRIIKRVKAESVSAKCFVKKWCFLKIRIYRSSYPEKSMMRVFSWRLWAPLIRILRSFQTEATS